MDKTFLCHNHLKIISILDVNMTTTAIYNIIKNTNNHLQTYENLIKTDYSKDIIKIVYLIDFGINIDDLIIEKQEREKRKYQKQLRDEALIKYSRKCAISGQNKERLLEVAHIKPVKDCENINEKKDVNNTLLLWLDLHKYFDNYSFSINPDSFEIEVDSTKDDNLWLMKYNKMVLCDIDNKMIKYLKHHYLIFLNCMNSVN